MAAQVLDISGTPPTAELTHALRDRAGGNPFFVEELLAAGDGDELPDSLRDALLVRLRRLSERAREIVDVASVAGRPIDHRLLRALVVMGDGELIGGLREAVAQQVLISDGLSYAFRHALLREAVYADLVAGQRTPIHAALAEKLSREPTLAGAQAAVAAEIAHHWTAAGEIEAALAASVRAGEEAERMYAIQEARRQYERVLSLWDRVAEPERITGLSRSTLLARTADAEWLAGNETRAVALSRAALEHPQLQHDDAGAARVEERLASYLWAAGDSDGALQAARRAVAHLDGREPSADRARALCAEGRMLVMRSRNQEARERLEESLEIARTIGASSEEAQALNYLGGALAFLGDYTGGIERLRTAVRIARETGSRARGLSPYENLSEVLAEAGRLEDARDVASEGEFHAAERHLAAADAMAARIGDPMWTGPVAAARAELELWRGQPLVAAEIVRAALAVGPERQCLQHTSELYAVGARSLAELAVAARARHQDSAACAEGTALLARLESRVTSSFPLGAAPPRVSADIALCRAEVRRAGGDSDHHTWAAAVTAADAAGQSTRCIYARWRLTEALLAHSIRDRAETTLREAAHRAAAIEHEPVTREIRALARRARISLTTDSSPSEATQFGLSPRETEVLGLLAGGLTNKEIAATLYISDKTAEHHVSRILGKLGVSTRTAAGSLAYQLGIRQTDAG